MRRKRREIVDEAASTEVIDERVVAGVPVAASPGAGPDPIGAWAVEEELGTRVVSEDESIRVGPDGTVTREYDRIEQPVVRRRFARNEIGWAMLVLLALVVAAGLAWWYFSRAETKQVPAVTGLRASAAVNRLQQRGFKTAITNEAHAESPGVVFAQRPGAGRDEKQGSTVRIFVSQGPATVVVPNAVGLSEAAARDRIVAAGFRVTETRIFSQQPAGTVTAQNPAAGGRAAKAATIQINVSKGTGLVIVPNVIGQALGNAETVLARAGLKPAVQFHVPSTQPVGTVVAQNPPGGQARQGSTVELNVSRGSSQSASPSTSARPTTSLTSTTP